jgi:hypothetical protein
VVDGDVEALDDSPTEDEANNLVSEPLQSGALEVIDDVALAHQLRVERTPLGQGVDEVVPASAHT